MRAPCTMPAICLQYQKLGSKQWSNWHSPERGEGMRATLGALGSETEETDEQPKRWDEMRGSIGLLQCGQLPLSCQRTTAAPLSFIFSISPSLMLKSKPQEKLLFAHACVRVCDRKRECKEDKREHREGEGAKLFSILFCFLSENWCWSNKKKKHQSEHQTRAAATRKALLSCTIQKRPHTDSQRV